MLRIYIFLFFAFFIKITSLAQTFEIKGLVVDSATLSPIAYASVGIKSLGMGTITNQQGNFTLKLPSSAMKKKVEIQFLGYNTYSFLVQSVKMQRTFKLVLSPKEIREVIVVPQDTLRNLLRLAYKAIPKNYPTVPTMYTGFYREVQKANDTLYLNFTEAILEVYKDTYKENHNFGQIRILKSRKNNFPGLDTINNVRFYGGPFIPHSLDFVFSRSNFIHPKHLKDFQYWLLDSKKNDNDDVYVIGFEGKGDSIKGVLYLDAKTLAYMGAEIHESGEKRNKGRFLLRQYKYGDADEKIGYIKQNDKWHLGYITFNSTGYNTVLNKKVYKTIEYVTTSIHTDSVKPIPYEQEFAPLDILSMKAEDYSSSSWNDYNILQENSSMEAQIQNTYSNDESVKILARKYPAKENKKDKIFSFLSHYSGDFGVGYLPFSSPGGLYQISYTDDSGNKLLHESKIASFDYSLSLYSKMDYTFNKHWGLFFSSISSLSSKQKYNSLDVGIQYFTPLFKHGRRWFADFGIAYSNTNYKLKLGNAEKIGNELSIKNKRFDTDKVDVFLGKRLSGIKPELSIKYKLGKFTSLSFSASSLIEFDSNDRVYFKESSGFFLTRKTQSIPTNDNHLQLSIDNVTKTESNLSIQPYQVILGLNFSF